MSEQSLTTETDENSFTTTVESGSVTGMTVTVDVELPPGIDYNDTMQRVVEEYAGNIETFVRKTLDYGNSFATGPKIESLMKYGEVREDELPRLVAKQIYVRGFLDKLSRFYSLYLDDNEQMVADENVTDTLLDLANYSIMLVSQIRKYEMDDDDRDE